MRVTCAVCEAEFEARRSTAKFCSATCRQRQHRRPGEAGTRSALVSKVEREMRKAGVLDSVDGELAVTLARQITAPGATGVAGLIKQLNDCRARALATSTSVAQSTATESDPIDEMKERRERKAREAAGQA